MRTIKLGPRAAVLMSRAANSSHCEWSACGQYILTATLSPRLRVDNGIKIWWCGGQLLHIHPIDDLYSVSFQPGLAIETPAFPPVIPKPPEANESVAKYRPKGETDHTGESINRVILHFWSDLSAESKPASTYRPPGARGTTASDAYRRDFDSTPGSGASTPPAMFKGGKPYQRYVPGAPIPGAAAAVSEKKEKKPKKKTAGANGHSEIANGVEKMSFADFETKANGGEPDLAAGVDDAVQKKIRGVLKKVTSGLSVAVAAYDAAEGDRGP